MTYEPTRSPGYATDWSDAQRHEVERLEAAATLTDWQRGQLTALRRAARDPLDQQRVERLLTKHTKQTESSESQSIGILNGGA